MNSLISLHVIKQVLINKKYRATLLKTVKTNLKFLINK